MDKIEVGSVVLSCDSPGKDDSIEIPSDSVEVSLNYEETSTDQELRVREIKIEGIDGLKDLNRLISVIRDAGLSVIISDGRDVTDRFFPVTFRMQIDGIPDDSNLVIRHVDPDFSPEDLVDAGVAYDAEETSLINLPEFWPGNDPNTLEAKFYGRIAHEMIRYYSRKKAEQEASKQVEPEGRVQLTPAQRRYLLGSSFVHSSVILLTLYSQNEDFKDPDQQFDVDVESDGDYSFNPYLHPELSMMLLNLFDVVGGGEDETEDDEEPQVDDDDYPVAEVMGDDGEWHKLEAWRQRSVG